MEKLFSKSGAMDRRSFIKLSGLLGTGLVSTSIIPGTAEAVKFNRDTYKVSKTRLAMGTMVSMTLIHTSKDRAEEAIGRANEEIDRLTGLMNRFDDTTAVGKLNQEGMIKDLPPEIIQVISSSLHYHRLTHGAFDISIKPLVDFLREQFSKGRDQYPNERKLKEVLNRVGADQIELDGRSIRFKKPEMGITLDGIAKGYIVDMASKILLDHRIENHLINAGGDIRAIGARPDRRPWTVAIQDPRKNGQHPDMIHLTDAAIATSGNYEVYFDREKMFHHIVDPGTGRSPLASSSVSVVAPSAMEADALSTSVFVMNPERGTRFIDSLPQCESLIISRRDRMIRSQGWKSAAI